MWEHSVRVDRRRCVGCTNCIKRCLTQAIRVQDGKARIMDNLCVDCCECMIACPHGAMVTAMSRMAQLTSYKYNIAIPSPALYAQFKGLWDIEFVAEGLKSLGFDYVYEEAKAAEIVAEATRDYLLGGMAVTPTISSFCPVVVRLVQQEYPALVDNLLPIEMPAEIAARLARKEFCEMEGVSPKDVGVFHISPCAARMTSAKHPISREKSAIDGVISILEIYGDLARFISRMDGEKPVMRAPKAGAFGVGTGMSGGVAVATGTSRYLAVDGMSHVVRCLEELENGKLNDMLFLELSACCCGCVGGPLTFEYSFMAKSRLRRIANSLPRYDFGCDEYVLKHKTQEITGLERPFSPKPVQRMGEDLITAARNMEKAEQILKGLPGLDCGSCGSPSCRALAEDIVKGTAVELDCIFKMRDKIRYMAQEMIELADVHRRG
ncbi:MAG: [Fe-Fe] hydrogenase large subunit C-terminal domain-containing protein [Christensenellales bacterium]|jgi:iron only hydrogenase large subunit-like protein